ncbi:MAG TPA: hypothetical protein VKM94_23180 [Blastocatellia bacterium]|nr:hypothetical protein [Blastocatellia bacterium]
MSIILLYVLATLDSAFCGFRSAAGRNALIDKRNYYRRAMVEGALAGQVAVSVVGLIALAVLSLSSEPAETKASMLNAARSMTAIYLPYAVVVLGALALKAAPTGVDVRSTLSALVFGPLTLIRPAIALAGAAWAVIRVPRPEILVLGAVSALLMVSMEWLLGLRYSARVAVTASSPAEAEERCRP